MMRPILEAEQPIDREREHFWAIGLDRGNMTKFVELTNLGNAWSVDATPSNVFRLAVMRACSSVIVCHNHPSGGITPSPEDDKFTDLLIEAGKIIGINVLDHVIICDHAKYYSYADNGKMKEVTHSPNPLQEKFITTKKSKKKKDNVNDPCNLKPVHEGIDVILRMIDELKAVTNKEVWNQCLERAKATSNVGQTGS